MSLLFHCLCFDGSLGRVDKSSFSVETLMEILLNGFTFNKEKICPDSEETVNIKNWTGVTYTADEISSIEWSRKDLEGTLALQCLPSTIRRAIFSQNALSGAVDLTDLPPKLSTLNLSTNRFFGTVDLTRLPPTMKNLSLDNNDFEGMTDFSKIPDRMIFLCVEDTKIEGDVQRLLGRTVWCDRSGVRLFGKC